MEILFYLLGFVLVVVLLGLLLCCVKWAPAPVTAVAILTFALLAIAGLGLYGLARINYLSDKLHTLACGFPIVSTWLVCASPVPDFETQQLSARFSDPATTCNIFGGLIASPDEAGLYIPTIPLALNLAQNISFWKPSTEESDRIKASVVNSIPALDAAYRDLSNLLAQSQTTYEFAQSTLSQWEKIIHMESSRATIIAWFCRALGCSGSRAVPRLAEDILADIRNSFNSVDEKVSKTLNNLDTRVSEVIALRATFTETSQLAWSEEWTAISNDNRRWLPGTSMSGSQVDLRRQVRVHSSFSACALEYSLAAMRRVASALETCHHLPAHLNSDVAADVTIAVTALQNRAKALKEANIGLQRMLG